MRLRTLAASLVVAAAATLPLAGVAAAQPDRDCKDFSSQAEAQAALGPTDRERLDSNDDGQACENYDYGSSPAPADDEGTGEQGGAGDADEDDSDRGNRAERDRGGEDRSTEDRRSDEGGSESERSDDDRQVTLVPRGGVDTGDGSSGPGPAPFVVAGVVATAAVAGAAHRRTRTSR